MEFVSYTLDDEQQFWDELDEIVSIQCQSHEAIDDSLRNYLGFTTKYKGDYLQTDYDVARCSYRLLDSTLFEGHRDYVRRQIIYCLLQEDDADVLHLIAAFLLFDGKQNEETFEKMNEEGAFPRILELIPKAQEQDAALHRILLQLLYEMSRIQRIRVQDLMLIEDDFIVSLLQIIEGLSDDVSDPYHYPVIRVLLVLNEQYMVCAHDPGPGQVRSATTLPNRVIKALSLYGNSFKTFGENIILLLNRESETSLQLLILKLLYLLFTTRATHEYFYTNDLRVLVDVMIRNLLDLPFTAVALRHTYLRVLHPLLAHTQLKDPENNYKRDEILKLLGLMAGSTSAVSVAHFGSTDETTKRLAARCAQVPWLRPRSPPPPPPPPLHSISSSASVIAPGESSSGGESPPPRNRYLSIGTNARAAESSLSVVEVAAHRVKPGVQTPSRGKQEAAAAAAAAAKQKDKTDGETTAAVVAMTDAEFGEGKSNGNGNAAEGKENENEVDADADADDEDDHDDERAAKTSTPVTTTTVAEALRAVDPQSTNNNGLSDDSNGGKNEGGGGANAKEIEIGVLSSPFEEVVS